MKFFVCIALFFAAAAQGHVIQSPALATYAAPYTTYSAGIAPVASVYSSPTVYSTHGYAAPVVSSAYAAPTFYTAGSHIVGAPSVLSAPHVVGAPSVLSAPHVVSAPSVYSALLKK